MGLPDERGRADIFRHYLQWLAAEFRNLCLPGA
jgi:hypothetical protein